MNYLHNIMAAVQKVNKYRKMKLKSKLNKKIQINKYLKKKIKIIKIAIYKHYIKNSQNREKTFERK